MAQTNRLMPVGEDEPVPDLIQAAPPRPVQPPPPPSENLQRITSMLMLALRALSQRFIIAIESILDFVIVGSVFWVALTVVTQPSPLQLTELGGYSVFVLAVLYMRRRE
jgi:hypothetical protein